MRAQDPVYQRTRELLALQDQLQKQVDEFRFEKNQKTASQSGRLASPLHWGTTTKIGHLNSVRVRLWAESNKIVLCAYK